MTLGVALTYPTLYYATLPYPTLPLTTLTCPMQPYQGDSLQGLKLKTPQNHFATCLAMHNCFLAALSGDKHAMPY